MMNGNEKNEKQTTKQYYENKSNFEFGMHHSTIFIVIDILRVWKLTLQCMTNFELWTVQIAIIIKDKCVW